ncbi:M20 family metallo-hydrolase [Vannielia sp.]|uniref:M20 family metallo-hydrolase n=1 Tax=Vannielia sp. TaxID=2813045 RepID=UPI00263091C9|nr:M20 family metallo-hydrolase [Vannielia sp.]MDF1872329.1 M20 family metallo-hydrolase [Vannielia sp.]
MAQRWGERAEAHLRALAKISAGGPGVTRLPYTAEHRAALVYLARMMTAAGLVPQLDAAATLIGRKGEGRTFYLGSHQDSVPNGGAYDGIAGVVLAILAVELLAQEGVELPFAVEVCAFADEEGVRFPTALVGSRALAGSNDMATLAPGEPMRAAMEAFGVNPEGIPALARDPAKAIGYLEAHIEQGPVLERAGEALGVVTAICGIERHQVRLRGETGHAGTLPMEGRQDALVGAAALVTEVNRLARSTPQLRGTVGALELAPNAVNAVPGEVRLTIELRSEDDALREQAGAALTRFAQATAKEMRLGLEMRRSYHQPAAPCDAKLRKVLAGAMRTTGGKGMELPSGATHDASAMADLCPIAMLFLRCKGGLSHRPEESATPGDLGQAVVAMAAFLRALPAA